jgi:hypothetical protein
MTQCEANADCKTPATQILSVGSLGRVVKLCPGHLATATGPLDANLTPYQLTGLEASYSPEQSLSQQVDTLDAETDELTAQLHQARLENARLRELLVSRLREQNARLSDEVHAMAEENAALQQTHQV